MTPAYPGLSGSAAPQPTPPNSLFTCWFDALYHRHTQALTFAEIRRGLQALSDIYVHGRQRLQRGDVFDGRGKRAAFALYYAPLHYLLIQHIVAVKSCPTGNTVLDLGCGTGAGAAAWAQQGQRACKLIGHDLNSWALGEARWNWNCLGLTGAAVRNDAHRAPVASLRRGDGVLAAYLVNELPDANRAALLDKLCAAHARGVSVLVVEPIAKRMAPWWPAWQAAFTDAGGVVDAWNVPARLPPKLALLDKAAGLCHATLKGRSLYLPGAPL